MKNQKQSLNKNAAILIVSTILVKVISAIFKIPLATDTFLGDIGFGYFSIAHDIFMPFYVLSISGLPVAVSHITAQKLAEKSFFEVKNNYYKIKKLFILSGLVFSFLISLISIPFILLLENTKNTFLSILAMAPSVFLCFATSIYRGYFEGFNYMIPTAISKMIEAIIKLVFGLTFAYLVIKYTSNPAYAAAAAMMAITFGNTLSLLYLFLKFKNYNLLNKLDAGETTADTSLTFKMIFLLAVPFALASLSNSFVALVDVFTVKFQIANASSEYIETVITKFPFIYSDITTYLYGIRSKAFTLFNLIPTITMSLGVGVLPVLTNLKASEKKSELKSNINYSLKLISVLSFPSGIGLTVLSFPIMNLLFDTNNTLGGSLLLIYGLAAIFAGISVPLTTVLQSIGLHYRVLKHIFIAFIIKISVNTFLALFASLNIFSVAFGTLAFYIYLLLIFLKIIKLEVSNISFIDSLLKPLLSAILCGVVAFIISSFSNSNFVTIFAIFMAIFVYFISILFTKTFSKNELKYLFFFK